MTTGKGSNFQLTRIAAAYNEIQENGQILSNRKAMEILWLRVQQLAERIENNEAPERLENIRRLWVNYRLLRAEGKEVEAMVVARKLDDEFEAAYHDYAAWRQMMEILQLHAKMTESEVKIMKDLRVIMTAEDAYNLVAQVMSVMLQVLKDDPKKLKEAQYGLARIVGEGLDQRFGGRSREGGSGLGPGDVDREGVFDTGDTERSETARPDAIGPISEGRDQGDIPEG